MVEGKGGRGGRAAGQRTKARQAEAVGVCVCVCDWGQRERVEPSARRRRRICRAGWVEQCTTHTQGKRELYEISGTGEKKKKKTLNGR